MKYANTAYQSVIPPGKWKTWYYHLPVKEDKIYINIHTYIPTIIFEQILFIHKYLKNLI